MNSLIDGEGLLWQICLEKRLWGGGSYFNKYLMGEDGCIRACVCLVVGVWLFICVAISVCISMSHLKGVLNEGEDHFLTPSPKWGNLIFFSPLHHSSPSHLLSSSLPAFHPSRDPSPWKLNEGMYRVGSAVSGPAEAIWEELFLPLLLQSTWEKKSQKKVYPAIIAQ